MGGADRIGKVTTARIADRRHMIDVDAQPERVGAEAARHQTLFVTSGFGARLPGLTDGIAASESGRSSAA